MTAQPTANDGEIDPAEEAGAGAGASAATAAPMNEQTVTNTARIERIDLETAIMLSQLEI